MLTAPARIAIGSLAGAYLGFKILVPVVGWAFLLFKGARVVWILHLLLPKGSALCDHQLDYIFGDGLDSLIRELDKHGR